MTDGTGATSYHYDSLGRRTASTDGAGHQTTHGYDLAGHLTQLGYPDGQTVSYSYDGAGNLTSVTDWLSRTTTYSYDADGNVLQQANPNKTGSSTSYTPLDQTSSIAENGPSGPLAAYNYTYNAGGLLSNTVTTGIGAKSESYSYDALNRLTNASGAVLSYDNAGDLTKTESGSSQGFDVANELTSQPYSYDAAGNRTTGYLPGSTLATYSYDSANRLTAVSNAMPGNILPEVPAVILLPISALLIGGAFLIVRRRKFRPAIGGALAVTLIAGTLTGTVVAHGAASASADPVTSPSVTASYTYNGDGLRMSKTVNGAPDAYTWNTDATVPLLLQESTGGSTTSYIYGVGDSPIEQVTGTTASWLLHDRLGSVRLVTDQAGTAIGSATYNAYGTATWIGQASAFGYAGEYTDTETGFLYLRARFYDSATAQFVSVDPEVGTTSTPYTYASDNPVLTTDPSGLFAIGQLKVKSPYRPLGFYQNHEFVQPAQGDNSGRLLLWIIFSAICARLGEGLLCGVGPNLPLSPSAGGPSSIQAEIFMRPDSNMTVIQPLTQIYQPITKLTPTIICT